MESVTSLDSPPLLLEWKFPSILFLFQFDGFPYTLYQNSPLSQDDPGGECRQRGAEQEDVAVHWVGRPSAGEPPLHPLQAQLRERQVLDGQRVSS